jgi:hypothetical protein
MTGTENADAARAVSEAHRHYAVRDFAEVEISRFCAAMLQILGDNAARIEEIRPRFAERNAVLDAVGAILGIVPFETRRARH